MTAEASTANKTIIIIPLNIDTRDIIRSANIATDSLLSHGRLFLQHFSNPRLATSPESLNR